MKICQKKIDICGVNLFSSELRLLYPPEYHHNIPPAEPALSKNIPNLAKEVVDRAMTIRRVSGNPVTIFQFKYLDI